MVACSTLDEFTSALAKDAGAEGVQPSLLSDTLSPGVME